MLRDPTCYIVHKCVLQNRQLCYYAFSREKLPVKCDNMTYLGITEGLYDSLVLALSKSDANENIWMTTVRALEKMVGHEPPDFRIAGYLPCRFVFFKFKGSTFSWSQASAIISMLYMLYFAFSFYILTIALGFCRWGLILCPNVQITYFLCAHNVQVGGELIFFC